VHPLLSSKRPDFNRVGAAGQEVQGAENGGWRCELTARPLPGLRAAGKGNDEVGGWAEEGVGRARSAQAGVPFDSAQGKPVLLASRAGNGVRGVRVFRPGLFRVFPGLLCASRRLNVRKFFSLVTPTRSGSTPVPSSFSQVLAQLCRAGSDLWEPRKNNRSIPGGRLLASRHRTACGSTGSAMDVMMFRAFGI